VNLTTAEHPVRARLGTWPHEPDVAHLVLLDHHMVPTADDVRRWIEMAEDRCARIIRTGALFPASMPAFEAAGFSPIDTLALLERDLHDPVPPAGATGTWRMRRTRTIHLDAAAAVDREAFGPTWSNDVHALADIRRATPRHRCRHVEADGGMVAFALSGRAGSWGYVQRLAVEPAAQRRGLARLLVTDALRWMHRGGARRAMVNTASSNDAALALYRSLGFEVRPEQLTIAELALRPR
jgi:ribosomal protein S18 acetylase RimI-like enzyme